MFIVTYRLLTPHEENQEYIFKHGKKSFANKDSGLRKADDLESSICTLHSIYKLHEHWK